MIKFKKLNKNSALVTIIASLTFSAPVIADDETGWHAQREEIKKQFDADGDGKLNKTERQAAKETFKQKRKEYIDKDGDGEISETERAAMKEERKARIIEKFDADGDGKLNEAERQVVKEKRRAKIVKRFDADGDGTLNDSELEAANAAKEKLMQRLGYDIES
jgi:Ca2+-binding EF-hand superfamily protein